jgi:hypothetical protein
MPTSATPPAFPMAHGEGAAGKVESGFGEVECFADP